MTEPSGSAGCQESRLCWKGFGAAHALLPEDCKLRLAFDRNLHCSKGGPKSSRTRPFDLHFEGHNRNATVPVIQFQTLRINSMESFDLQVWLNRNIITGIARSEHAGRLAPRV
jgi:hypothetical protein